MNETVLQMVPFSKLAAPDEINARGKSKEGIDEMCASILAQMVKAGSSNPADGLIQPLAVRPGDNGKLEIKDGRRRHMALAKLVKDGKMKKSDPVPVIVRDETDSESLETSLMANTVRLPMHPVDQHEVFARLVDQGNSESEIAARFGIAEKTVRQHLALGRLAPAIREAYRKGKIDSEIAKAFTLHADLDVQASLYEQLRKQNGGRFGVYQVRGALDQRRVPVKQCEDLAFVGKDAYVSAGGKLTESLFDDDEYVDDVPLVNKLAADKLKAKCAEFFADGWAWAELEDDMPQRWGSNGWGNWANVKDDDENEDSYDPGVEAFNPDEWSADERAKSGCIIGVGRDGELNVFAGLIKPEGTVVSTEPDEEDDGDFEGDDESEDDDIDAEADGEASEGNPFSVSMVLAQSVSIARTAAAAQAIDLTTALRLVVAALTCRHSAPAAITNNGHNSVRVHGTKNFAEVFASLPADTRSPELHVRFCEAIGTTLDLTFETWRYKGRDSGIDELVAALDGATFTAAAREHFNAADYFKRAKKSAAIAAIDEIREAGFGDGLAPEDVLAGMKQADLAAAAAERAQACGWLPPELRHPAYALGVVKIAIAAEQARP
ncbi:ParB/RepB/Spo0J family partition protein [Hyphomicrobium sp. ghe19]|uniref:ParB/RepB/Spo0J family partition protein n=1 Tax=Hyphomicrobium sp. ghe19 TaxID=2682968 RepID=UPI00136758FA|nr:Chromosome-partitioning protein Spo0J [Hyphomicrobium sp. ghe19]